MKTTARTPAWADGAQSFAVVAPKTRGGALLVLASSDTDAGWVARRH